MEIKKHYIQLSSIGKKMSVLTFFCSFIMFSISVSQAHNKVVVIPLLSDDASAQIPLEPFVMISKDDTSDISYISVNGVTLDPVTGLEWQQVDNDIDYTFDDAGSIVLA